MSIIKATKALFKNIKKAIKTSKKEQLTFNNMKGFIQGNVRKFLEDIDYNNLDYYIREQIIYRSLTCRTCTIEGKCVICGCQTPEKFYEDRACEGEKYPYMLEEKEWLKFKQDNNINEEDLMKTILISDKSSFNFGNIEEGEKVFINIALTNKGLLPATISSISSSCGCTTANTGKSVLDLEESTEIKISYDSTGKSGKFYKTVTVKGNFEDIKISISGFVTSKQKEDVKDKQQNEPSNKK